MPDAVYHAFAAASTFCRPRSLPRKQQPARVDYSRAQPPCHAATTRIGTQLRPPSRLSSRSQRVWPASSSAPVSTCCGDTKARVPQASPDGRALTQCLREKTDEQASTGGVDICSDVSEAAKEDGEVVANAGEAGTDGGRIDKCSVGKTRPRPSELGLALTCSSAACDDAEELLALRARRHRRFNGAGTWLDSSILASQSRVTKDLERRIARFDQRLAQRSGTGSVSFAGGSSGALAPGCGTEGASGGASGTSPESHSAASIAVQDVRARVAQLQVLEDAVAALLPNALRLQPGERAQRRLANECSASITEVEQVQQAFLRHCGTGNRAISREGFETLILELKGCTLEQRSSYTDNRLAGLWKRAEDDCGGEMDFEAFFVWYRSTKDKEEVAGLAETRAPPKVPGRQTLQPASPRASQPSSARSGSGVQRSRVSEAATLGGARASSQGVWGRAGGMVRASSQADGP